MRKIYKYEISERRTRLYLPKGHVIRHVATQRDQICIWAEVNTNEKEEVCVFISVYGTGQAIPDRGETYLGTVLIDNGEFVWHVYQENGWG
jgi:hypothetical protein